MNISVLPLTVLNQVYSDLTREQRGIISSDPIAAGALPLIDGVVGPLRQCCVAESRDQSLKKLNAAIAEMDAAHDAQLRMLWQLLHTELNFSQLTGEDAEHVACVKGVIDALFPDGLSQTTKSYLQEVSEAPLLYAALTRRQIRLLESLVYRGMTGLEIVRRWLAAAEKLGDLIRRRAVLEATSAEALPTGNGREVRSMALVRLGVFLDVLAQSDLDETIKSALRAPIAAAVQEHEKRLARKNGADEGPEGDEAELAAEDAAPAEGAGQDAPVATADPAHPPAGIEAQLSDDTLTFPADIPLAPVPQTQSNGVGV